MEYNFCRRCGTNLEVLKDHEFKCKNDHIIFKNPSPTVGIFFVDGDDVILSVRGRDPFKGSLDSLGGFLDGQETFEEALKRELKEEAGLQPLDYSTPKFLCSATSLYEYGSEKVPVVSVFFWSKLSDKANITPLDDVEKVVKISIQDIKVNDIPNIDVRSGLIKLQKLHQQGKLKKL